MKNKESGAAALTLPEADLGTPDGRHIVDILIEERARHLLERPLVWGLIRSAIYPLLKYKTAVEMADAIAEMSAWEVMEFVSGLLQVRLKMTGLENIPKSGRFMLVANHPTGIADGVAVFDALKNIRPDMCFFANRDALRIAPRLEEMVIPVEWVMDSRSKAKTREMVKRMMRAFREDNAIIMFPSGKLARPYWRGLREHNWLTTTINLAHRYDTPIVPLHMGGRNSLLYYFFHLTSPELRDMTLFNELLNKRNYPFTMRFGTPIQPGTLNMDTDIAMAQLKSHVEDELSQDPSASFNP